jgi:hypothetical protein
MIIGDSSNDRKYINKKSKKQEERTADKYKGSRNAGSGSGWLRKNDVRSEMFLIENKFTDNVKSYTIKAVDLRDLEKRSILESRIPVLQFDINLKSYVVLIEDDFLELIGE